jgi:ferric-dicitrate binding protein FerR (iron transport regulator)
VKSDLNDSVKELIVKYLAGETSVAEAQELQSWIAKAPDNERQFVEFKKMFEVAQKHYPHQPKEINDINIDDEWNHFLSTVNKNSEEENIRRINHGDQPSRLWFRIAASLLLLVASGVAIIYFNSKDNGSHFHTANNTLNVSLPDGSTVTLNRNSDLSFSDEFGKDKRTVSLKGEAFFNVEHNPQKPFVIEIRDATVEVVGTSFNVRAYDSLNDIEVIVKTGVVRFSRADAKDEVKLTAGEKGIYKKESKRLTSVVNEDLNFLSWNTRKIIFNEAALSTVVETLNKTYGVHITIATVSSPTCVVTVTFDHQTLDAVLHVLETTLNLTYRIDGNQIEITQAGC